MTFADSCALLSCRIFFKYLGRTKFSCNSAVKFHMDFKNEARSTMEIDNVQPIVSIYRQALLTFKDISKDFNVNLNKLKSMMDSLKAEDLRYDTTLSDPATWRPRKKAPCTYVEVFQNDVVNMSIFVLRPGFKMPLHDHPQMYGLLKVISGAINIRSFTEYPLTEAMNNPDCVIRAKQEAARRAQGIYKDKRLFAEVSQSTVCRANSETCILTPTTSNYHEIEALSMPAAFFDVLAPPYDTLIEGVGPRQCTYYYIAHELRNNMVQLHQMEAPDYFYCDELPYLGPCLR